MSILKNIIGPRVPRNLSAAGRRRYRRSTLLFMAAAAALLLSMLLPYWRMQLNAPQYPGGLSVQVYINRMTGDVAEIDGLNHYIGMRPLEEAAQLERSVSVAAVIILALLVLAAATIHTRWAVLLALPAILMPFLFLADLYYWMRDFGLNLDPTAALSSSIEPFVPPLLGTGMVGQFETVAVWEVGLWLAFLAVGLALAGLYFHRQMFKPLVEQA